ncbi:uncharacterized protein LOC142645112 [Dermatophagoides pteronyssinus]|uniref:uncharacterized protein LOC142645112 n=1 Tax=Dermatophagoides pteronyssinus TaxID=6956 RepID=UPI003F6677FC
MVNIKRDNNNGNDNQDSNNYQHNDNNRNETISWRYRNGQDNSNSNQQQQQQQHNSINVNNNNNNRTENHRRQFAPDNDWFRELREEEEFDRRHSERLRRYYQRQNERVQMNEELERIRQQQPPNQPLPLEFIMGMRPSIDFNNSNPNSNSNRHRHRNYDPRNDNRRYR